MRLVLVKGEDGKLAGLGEVYGRAYERFLRAVSAMQPGDTVGFDFVLPRSPGYHRRFFAMLNELLSRQERFTNMEHLRAWLTVGAGYCELVPGPGGEPVALPRSLAWTQMDEAEFREFVLAVHRFLQTEHAQRFLWPHLVPRIAAENSEALLAQFA